MPADITRSFTGTFDRESRLVWFNESGPSLNQAGGNTSPEASNENSPPKCGIEGNITESRKHLIEQNQILNDLMQRRDGEEQELARRVGENVHTTAKLLVTQDDFALAKMAKSELRTITRLAELIQSLGTSFVTLNDWQQNLLRRAYLASRCRDWSTFSDSMDEFDKISDHKNDHFLNRLLDTNEAFVESRDTLEEGLSQLEQKKQMQTTNTDLGLGKGAESVSHESKKDNVDLNLQAQN